MGVSRTHPLLRRLRELELPVGDYAVFGSGPLLVRGVIDDAGDLDVLVGERSWTAATAHGDVIHLDQYGVDVVEVDGGAITIGRVWGIGEFDVDELIATAETIDGLPFVRLEHVVAYKREAARPKDVEHLHAMVQAGLL
jgi:hypothetical protein